MKRYFLGRLKRNELNEIEPDLPPGVWDYAPCMAPGADEGDDVLLLIASRDITPLVNSSKLVALPDFGKDIKVNAMHAATFNRMRDTLRDRLGLVFDQASGIGYREVIRQVGRELDPNFHEDAFDVSE